MNKKILIVYGKNPKINIKNYLKKLGYNDK